MAFVRLDEAELAALPNVELYPGMPATVMIPTVQRTAIEYVVGPLVMSSNHSIPAKQRRFAWSLEQGRLCYRFAFDLDMLCLSLTRRLFRVCNVIIAAVSSEMAVYIAIVRSQSDVGYTASFPDFPGLAVAASSLELLFAEARQKIVTYIEHLLETNQPVGVPKSAEAIDGDGALMLAAIELPDDVRTVHIELAVPALALVRIDAFAQRHGLTRSALFSAAVQRWEAQEHLPRERRGETADGPTLFDFVNPLELRVDAMPANVEPPVETVPRNLELANTDDITSELERLLEETSEPQSHDTESDCQQERDPKGR